MSRSSLLQVQEHWTIGAGQRSAKVAKQQSQQSTHTQSSANPEGRPQLIWYLAGNCVLGISKAACLYTLASRELCRCIPVLDCAPPPSMEERALAQLLEHHVSGHRGGKSCQLLQHATMRSAYRIPADSVVASQKLPHTQTSQHKKPWIAHRHHKGAQQTPAILHCRFPLRRLSCAIHPTGFCAGHQQLR